MLRLMIVDDEQIIRESLSEMIDYASLGYELIATAKNGMEAYDIICDEYPDVVITDIRMPFLNGLDLIQRAQKADSHINFILLSGYGEFEYAKQAMKYGVKHYLLKPTDKQELIDALCSIRQDILLEEKLKQEKQQEMLCELQSPLEQCFLMEALERLDEFPAVYSRYSSLLSFPPSCLFVCICTFVEQSYLEDFLEDAYAILEDLGLPLQFPILYVKNTAVIIAPFDTLSSQDNFRERICSLSYPIQTVTFDLAFLHEDSTEALFKTVVGKIARFETILLMTDQGAVEIHNNLTSSWKLRKIEEDISQITDRIQASGYLTSLFPDDLPLESAKDLALSLFLRLDNRQSTEIACDFFGKLYGCASVAQVRELMEIVLIHDKPDDSSKSSSNILLLKAYVDQHLDSENLSLKWLAENYLFVSVGYLSKQFIREEGMRFSEYLNKKRMDEAIRLMVYYNNDNIKHIAKQVGFGNNPQYFSQVFKRYTGSTPSDYIENIRRNS